MRARLGLAHCLWDIGRKDDAVEHSITTSILCGWDLASGRISGPFVVGGVDIFGHLHLHRCLS